MCIYCGNNNHTLMNGSGLYSLAENGTNQDLANYLTEGFWNDYGTTKRKFNLSNNGFFAKNGTITYNTSANIFDSDGLSNSRAELVKEAFKIVEETTGINFELTNDEFADFRFGDSRSGAWTSASAYAGNINYVNINVSSSWNGGRSGIGNYTFQTILHEIGHGLGLGHQGNYNGWATYSSHAKFGNDSWQSSIMSYFSQSQNSTINADFSYLSSFMAVDWIAIDDLYSSPNKYGISEAFKDDTNYGFNTNISSSTSKIFANLETYIASTSFTIVDGGGVDKFDFSGFKNDQLIDLRASKKDSKSLYASNIAGGFENLIIAPGSIIEDVFSGEGSDVIIGNEADNYINGGKGFDTFVLSNNFNEYSFSTKSEEFLLEGEGSDTLKNIENIRFNNISKSVVYLEKLSKAYDISEHTIGSNYNLEYIKDIDGNSHGSLEPITNSVKTSYKYQGNLIVSNDEKELAVYTNHVTGRWVTASIEKNSNTINFSKFGKVGSTRIVGIYIDPLIEKGIVTSGSKEDSQKRFTNDLISNNLQLKTSGDFDKDGYLEIYWKTNDDSAYLRSLMHADGNIQYANYQSEAQLISYLNNCGLSDTVNLIL